MIGDLSEKRTTPLPLDYAFRAPDVPDWIATAAGLVSLVAVFGCLVSLILASRRGFFDGSWFAVIGLLMGAGVLAAGICRVATAGVHGASIGAGFALFLGGPLVLGLGVDAILRAWRITRRPVHA
jgi:hypothetical protein